MLNWRSLAAQTTVAEQRSAELKYHTECLTQVLSSIGGLEYDLTNPLGAAVDTLKTMISKNDSLKNQERKALEELQALRDQSSITIASLRQEQETLVAAKQSLLEEKEKHMQEQSNLNIK